MRRGVSLIELLVVIVIMVTVTAAAIPIFRPAMESRRIREASRLSTSFFESAKNRARGAGHEVGVRIDPLDNMPGGAMVLRMVEAPPMWAGDSINSRIKFQSGSLPEFVTPEVWQPQVHPGDRMKLNYRGHLWTIESKSGAADLNGLPDWAFRRDDDPPMKDPQTGNTKPPDDTKGPLYQPIPPEGVPFQFIRQPIASPVSPLTLPDGNVIDLDASGIASNVGMAGPVTIVFSSSGAVASVAAKGEIPRAPVGSIYLLIGKSEKIGLSLYSSSAAPAEQAKRCNFRDLENIWIGINPQTGLVSSSEVAAVKYDIPQAVDSVRASRQVAQAQQSMGGR